jgi:hypothetical protein
MRIAFVFAGSLLLPALATAAEDPYRPGWPVSHGLSLFVHEGVLRNGSDWDRAFNPLPGFDLEAGFVERNLRDSLGLGLYAGVGMDNYAGQTESRKGTTVDVGDFTLWSAYAGVRAQVRFGGGFFCEGSVGMGAARYPSIHETVTGGGVSESFEATACSYEVMLDAGLRAGYRVSSVALLAGVKYRLVNNPDLGHDALPDESPYDKLSVILFEVGARIDF